MDGAAPNQTPFPSSLPNSPFFAPFLQTPSGELLDLQPVREEVAVIDPFTHKGVTPQGPINVLARLRHDFPYIPITPVPNWTWAARCAAGVPLEVNFPAGVAVVRFNSAPPASLFLSFNGNAAIPPNGQPADGLIFNPSGQFFYVGGTKACSVISDVAGTGFSLSGYFFNELPRGA